VRRSAARALREHIGEVKMMCGIDPQRDRYGRDLGVCYAKGEELNA
jgi:endonuclease YncB( thermonuclease family)